MSLPLLVAMVVVGIAAIVVAVHLTGGTRRAVLADEEAARARFAVDYPRERVGDVVLSNVRETAFLGLEGGRTGIVQSLGGHFLTRIVRPGEVARLEQPSETTLRLRLRDITWPGGSFDFASAAEARRIAGRFAGEGARARRSA